MAARRRRASSRERRVRAVFRAFVVCAAVFAMLGLTRVSLSARVTEASMFADDLRCEIAAEQLITESLSVDRGVLTDPERLTDIAGASMGMCVPQDVEFLAFTSEPDPGAESLSIQDEADDGFTLRSVVAAVMDMAAGEAEALLVGDIGLAAAR